jgi:hypothetical protein
MESPGNTSGFVFSTSLEMRGLTRPLIIALRITSFLRHRAKDDQR